MMSLGNWEGKVGDEAEPEELPDMGYLMQPAMDSLYFSEDKCVLPSKNGEAFSFTYKVCIEYNFLSLHINI